MSSSIVKLEKYRIPVNEICVATKNFSSETWVGEGGFGVVHKGQLSHDRRTRTVAVKRLNRDGYQGKNEFYNELEMVSSFDHPNVIPFIGYCDDANEMIMIYEYAANGSLDRHLQDPEQRRHLTWVQRLKICLGAARGLEYLHSGLGEDSRVIHRDVKSANILLDEKMEAMICDFGLSKIGPRNQSDTQVVTKASGTRCYIDPIYNERGRLSKEADIYSFGVVMFEMSSGNTRCFGDEKERYLIDIVRSCYEDNQLGDALDKLIDPDIRDHTHMSSFDTFNKIAHACISLDIKKRPTLDKIIQGIEKAWDMQEYNSFDDYQPSQQETRNSPFHFLTSCLQFFCTEKVDEPLVSYIPCDEVREQLEHLNFRNVAADKQKETIDQIIEIMKPNDDGNITMDGLVYGVSAALKKKEIYQHVFPSSSRGNDFAQILQAWIETDWEEEKTTKIEAHTISDETQ